MREMLKRIIPQAVFKYRTKLIDKRNFSRLASLECDTGSLRRANDINLSELLQSKNVESAWKLVEKDVSALGISDSAGGVNPGDRRVLFYLVTGLTPKSVLEVGTHVGASTIHIAYALKLLGDERRLDTVDIKNANDPQTKPWVSLGSSHAPEEMLRRIDCDGFVTFHTENSLNFLSRCVRKYDLIFLDGSHTATHVYQEIPAALRLLRSGGYLLLHDYFPDSKPLWSNGRVVHGPFMAVDRLRVEGAELDVKPLGKLPWPTKSESCITSLAILGST